MKPKSLVLCPESRSTSGKSNAGELRCFVWSKATAVRLFRLAPVIHCRVKFSSQHWLLFTRQNLFETSCCFEWNQFQLRPHAESKTWATTSTTSTISAVQTTTRKAGECGTQSPETAQGKGSWVIYWTYPPPSNSAKWRFIGIIGIPYSKYNNPSLSGDCYWVGGEPKWENKVFLAFLLQLLQPQGPEFGRFHQPTIWDLGSSSKDWRMLWDASKRRGCISTLSSF